MTQVQTKVDFALVRGTDGIYDLDDGDDGDMLACYGYETSIRMSVLGDSKATSAEVADKLRRGGWAGNENNEDKSFEIGSTLWTKYQSRKTEIDKNEAVAIVKDALSHFVPDRAKQINVTGNLSVNGIEITAVLLRYSGELDTVLFELWDTTEVD